MVASFVFNTAKTAIGDGGSIDWITDIAAGNIRIGLIETAELVANDQDADFVSVISGGGVPNEPDDASYARVNLANGAVTTDDTDNQAEYDADDPVFSSLAGTETIVGAFVYKFITNDAASIPIVWLKFPSSVVSNGGDFTVNLDAEGVFKITD